MISFKQFISEQTGICEHDISGDFLGDQIIIPKGTKVHIDKVTVFSDGSYVIQLYAIGQFGKTTLHFDSKREAEESLNIEL